ncbi:hypothetical protein [Croceitalea rosinachiae]|uniref:Uncharacterized protein n=1 Tax=Croceitalea rosinachiae TaxID=3075596 RepID=A0ABU3ACZ0_9FLAO|nr:hypothetical protein [Croceitalea sp. F388]MDT0608050.1 hypothetical protein [Croceitalea sp. F388]
MRLIIRFLRSIFLFGCIVLVHSCDEQIKNSYRDDIGQCIPEGQKAIVNLKYTDSPGGETRYFIDCEMFNGDTCTNLVTVHDFEFLKIGDTISRESARNECLKIHGVPCKEANRLSLKIILFVLIFIGIPFFIDFVYGDKLNELFKSTWVGKVWYVIKKFFKKLVHVEYGFNIFCLIVGTAEVLLGIVLWKLGIEIYGSVGFLFIVKWLLLFTTAAIVLLWIFGGLDNLMKNLTIISLGTIFICMITLFFGLLGLSYVDMVKFHFENMRSS